MERRLIDFRQMVGKCQSRNNEILQNSELVCFVCFVSIAEPKNYKEVLIYEY